MIGIQDYQTYIYDAIYKLYISNILCRINRYDFSFNYWILNWCIVIAFIEFAQKVFYFIGKIINIPGILK